MALPAGSRLGPYEVLSPLGAGGMGEVYKARDTRLERTVAIKVLPSDLAQSEETRQRFEREARTISRLSHPHICALHDIGREGEVEYLVMELLEGQSLAERLARGPLPVSEILRYGAQIASALDAAHRSGIVHRDLKPSNVMITKSGVKLLDFGIAKALEPPGTAEPLTSAATAAKDVTRPGMVVGTVPYMAPEQLQGAAAEPRGDIFSLGAVLYEMAAGRKAFDGASPASILSAILTAEPPPVSSFQPMSPAALDRLVRTCLAKDPDDRWQTARDVELQLLAIADAGSGSQAALPASRRTPGRRLPWIAAVAALAIAAAMTFAWLRVRAAGASPPPVLRFLVAPPPGGSFEIGGVENSAIAFSPDGSRIAFVGRGREGAPRIWLRPLSSEQAQPLAGTEGARSLFWSPDGRSIGFFAGDKLQRVEPPSGAPVTICDVPAGIGFSGTWGSGEILFASIQGEAIFRVSAAGGTPDRALVPDSSRGETRLAWPFFLPDGKRFLYLRRLASGESSLMLAAGGAPPRAVMPARSRVAYCDPGYLVFAREGALLAQRFDPGRGEVTGEPSSLAAGVRYFFSNGFASFTASRNGSVAYQTGDNVLRLALVDRTGREVGRLGPAGAYIHVVFSPDGHRILFDRRRERTGVPGVWSLDLERRAETPVTPGPETEAGPIMLPDGRTIIYSKLGGRTLQLVRRDLATGEEKVLVPSGSFQLVEDVSSDGKTLLYLERGPKGIFEIWSLPLSGDGAPPAVFRKSDSGRGEARFSPDGRYVAFVSSESGRPEAYVAPFPGPGEIVRVSPGGAQLLRWSRAGEILLVTDDNRLLAIPVRTAPSLEVRAGTQLFALQEKSSWWGFDVSPDGKTFVAIVPETIADEMPLSVVLNRFAEASR